MKFDCFYKVTVTQHNQETEQYWGRFPYTAVMISVEQLYRDGADAVELELITNEQFYQQISPPN